MLALHTRLSLAAAALSRPPAPLPRRGEHHQRHPAPAPLPPDARPVARQTVELLRACDLVKFARQEVGETQGRERAEAARRLAGEWESHLRRRRR